MMTVTTGGGLSETIPATSWARSDVATGGARRSEQVFGRRRRLAALPATTTGGGFWPMSGKSRSTSRLASAVAGAAIRPTPPVETDAGQALGARHPARHPRRGQALPAHRRGAPAGGRGRCGGRVLPLLRRPAPTSSRRRSPRRCAPQLVVAIVSDRPLRSVAVTIDTSTRETRLRARRRVAGVEGALRGADGRRARRQRERLPGGGDDLPRWRKEYLDGDAGGGAPADPNLNVGVAQVPGGPPGRPGGQLDGIRKVTDNRYEIDKAVIDSSLSNLNALATQARLVPSFKNGVANGFKLFQIQPGSLYSSIGIENGDVITRINGYEINSPDKALEIYQKLRESSHVTIELERGGQTIKKDYSITGRSRWTDLMRTLLATSSSARPRDGPGPVRDPLAAPSRARRPVTPLPSAPRPRRRAGFAAPLPAWAGARTRPGAAASAPAPAPAASAARPRRRGAARRSPSGGSPGDAAPPPGRRPGARAAPARPRAAPASAPRARRSPARAARPGRPGGRRPAPDACTPIQGRFMLSFSKADIVDVLEQASRWTCRNFIYGEDVAKGKITLLSKSPVTADEAYAAFLAALSSNGIALYQTGRYWKLIRTADAKKTPIPTYTTDGAETPGTEQPITKLIRLKYADADQMRGIMGNFISPAGRRPPVHPARPAAHHRHRRQHPAHREAHRVDRPGRRRRAGPAGADPLRPGQGHRRQGEPDLRPGAPARRGSGRRRPRHSAARPRPGRPRPPRPPAPTRRAAASRSRSPR